MRQLFLCLPLLALCVAVAYSQSLVEQDGVYWADDEIVVVFNSPPTPADIESVTTRLGSCSVNAVTDRMLLLRFPASVDEPTLSAYCDTLAVFNVAWSSPNYASKQVVDSNRSDPVLDLPDCLALSEEYLPPALVNDPLAPEQYYLGPDFLNVPPAWFRDNATLGFDPNLYICIFDSGLRMDHEEFNNNLQLSVIVGLEDATVDQSGHGTQVAGVIFAEQNNHVGISGIAPAAQVRVGKILTYESNANYLHDTHLLWSLQYLLNEATNNPVNRYIANYSCGSIGFENIHTLQYMGELLQQIAECHNVLIVASAGNSAGTIGLEQGGMIRWVAYPAAFSGEESEFFSDAINNMVVSVGALAISGGVGDCPYRIVSEPHTCWAGMDTCAVINDVSAMGGGDINETQNYRVLTTSKVSTNSYTYNFDGTSSAAALVSGAAALIWSNNIDFPAERIKSLLRNSAKKFTQNVYPDGTLGTPVLYSPVEPDLFHGWFCDYENTCPSNVLPDNPPVVYPDGSYDRVNFDTEMDRFASITMGSGQPDVAEMLETVSYENVRRVFGGVQEQDISLGPVDYLYIYGDLVLADGVTFEVAADPDNDYIVIPIWGTDLQRSGVDEEHVEIVIGHNAKLILHGSHIWFRPSGAGCGWAGITIMPGGSLILGSDIASGENGSIVVKNSDVSFQGMASFSAEPAVGAGETRGAVFVGECSYENDLQIELDGYDIGLDCRPEANVQLGGSIMINCGVTGFRTGNDAVVLVDGDLEIAAASQGIDIVINDGAMINTTAIGLISIDGGTYGLYFDAVSSATVEGNVKIANTTIAGIYLGSSSNCEIRGLQGLPVCVTRSRRDGIHIEDTANVTIANTSVEENKSVGIFIDGASSCIDVRDTLIKRNYTGVFCGAASMVWLGDYLPAAHGIMFDSNTWYDVVYLGSNAVNAMNNSWRCSSGGWQCPPSPGRVSGYVDTDCQ